MHAAVSPTQVSIGSEFVPRLPAWPENLIVPAGATVTLPADSTYRYIEVGGTLRANRAVGDRTVLRYVTLVILPGGLLDIGSEADPQLGRVEFIGRNVPIDFNVDPFQWGNGIVNFGTQYRVGKAKTHCAELEVGLVAGQTVIELAEAPEGWEVGDEVSIPDTVAPYQRPGNQPWIESPVFVAAINGTTLTLSKPLDFAHPVITKPTYAGRIVTGRVPAVYPCVCNLSRNIIVRSEDPTGTPTHNVDTAMDTLSIVKFNQIVGCGRTTGAVLDTTVRVNGVTTHVGTNQVGKYADHFHHAMGFMCVREGNVYDGRNYPCKWLSVTHGTHDVMHERNIGIGSNGAVFITEDGPESRNTFHHNIALLSLGAPGSAGPKNNIDAGRPGAEGTGFWMHGVRNEYVGNEAWNCNSGFNLMNQQQKYYATPSVPGGENDTPFTKDVEAKFALPLSMVGNKGICNVSENFDIWGVRRFPIVDLVVAHGLNSQVKLSSSDHPSCVLVNPTVLSDDRPGIDAQAGYTDELEVQGGLIAGCSQAFVGGGGGSLSKVVGVACVENQSDFAFIGARIVIDNTINIPRPGVVPMFVDCDEANSGDLRDSNIMGTVGAKRHLTNWQGTGQDYTLFGPLQRSTQPAPVSSQDVRYAYFCPEAGLNMAEYWERYGIAPNGEAAREEECVALEGVVGALARPGGSRFGPASGVLCSPTMREAAVVRNGDTYLYMKITGDPNGDASDALMCNLDGVFDFGLGQNPNQAAGNREVWALYFSGGRMSSLAPGTHTLTLWRLHKTTGAELPNSRRQFQFFVKTPSDPGTLPPAAPILTGTLTAGDTEVRGTGVTGATVTIHIDGMDAGVVDVVGGEFVVTVLPLLAGQTVAAVQTLNGLTSGSSNVLTVEGLVIEPPHDDPPAGTPGAPPPPTIDGPLSVGATVIWGVGVAGASIEAFVNGVLAPTGNHAGGNNVFATGVPALKAGDVVTARQTLDGTTWSGLSAPVTVRGVVVEPPHEDPPTETWHDVKAQRSSTSRWRLIDTDGATKELP